MFFNCHWKFSPQFRIRRGCNDGKYYCSVIGSEIEIRRVTTAEGTLADLPYVKRIVGRACRELTADNRVYVRTVATLDLDARRLYVSVKFMA